MCVLWCKYNIYKTLLKTSWNTFIRLSGTSLKVLWNYFRTFLELHWNFIGISLEFLFLELTYLTYFTYFTYLTYLTYYRHSCDSWGTDYYSDNWEPEFMTVFVSRQLRATLTGQHSQFLRCLYSLIIRFSWEGIQKKTKESLHGVYSKNGQQRLN